jgi:ABC-2 type transport system ATP-binding protein
LLVRAEGISRSFGSQLALAPMDFELRGGETVALVGPNGAGKSTLLALLAGSMAPTSGRVAWSKGVRAGWAPQRPAQYGRLSARENLELFARLEGQADRSASAAASRLLGAFGLPDNGRPSAELSVGNRQRLNVAIAMLSEPDALLLDEPTASLDHTQRVLLWEMASRLCARGGAVVFATQNEDELQHAQRVEVLRDGRLSFAGTVADYLRENSTEALA